MVFLIPIGYGLLLTGLFMVARGFEIQKEKGLSDQVNEIFKGAENGKTKS